MDRPTRPSRFDLALSGLLTVAAVAEVALTPALAPKVPAMTFEVVMAVALAFRRVHPITVVVIVAVAGTVDTLVGVPLNQGTMVLAAPVIAVYSVCAWASTREAFLASAIFLASFAIQSWAFDAGVGNWLFGFVFVVATLIAGITIQARTREAERLREAAVRHEAQLEMQARDAAEHERTRIARELHDVISHSVTVMVVQAGAAERVSGAGPPAPEALEAMRAIQHIGRQALGELSGLLGVLRDGDESVGLGPQPGLGALPELFERSAAAGVVVSAEVSADLARSLPVGPQLATFRIIQEALTNVRKHSAAPSARAQVCVGDGILRLTVDDDGPPREQGPVAPGGGLGLRGARERAKVYGGTVDAGPTPTGGFRVSATIPVGDER